MSAPVAVTGASGWLGRIALERLLASGREVVPFASVAKRIELRDGAAVDAHALADFAEQRPAGSHVLHLAYLTRERTADLGVERYLEFNREITAHVRKGLERSEGGLFLASSGAAYDESPDNAYGLLKREDEQLFAELAKPFVCARVFNVSGPYMTKPTTYALGDFILKTLAGQPIVINATHAVRRSYVAGADLIDLALALLDTGEGAAFDTAGDEIVEVGELAARVCAALDRDVPIERNVDAAAEADEYVGDGHVLRELAARHGVRLQPLDEQIAATAAWLQAV